MFLGDIREYMKLLVIILTVLQSLLTTLEQKTLETNFTLTSAQSAMSNETPMTYEGQLKMHGKQFLLNMLSMEAAYDGNTLYMYNEDVDELSLTNPSEEELIQTNPFLYAQKLLPICQYTEKAMGDKTQITLTPKDQSSGISKFILRVVTTTLLPTQIEVHETSGTLTTLRLINAHYTDSIPSFIIEKEGAFINDLR